MSDTILPLGWPRPSGYANAISATGRIVAVAGQVGWDPVTERIVGEDFVAQTRQALRNVVAILHAANVHQRQVVRMTWYITGSVEYLATLADVGKAYREVFGPHYPAMTLVIVAGLLEPGAKVEIEVTAVVPES
jgi:enamine deaminase RidA (YjgF/YER057c/UK114 family)